MDIKLLVKQYKHNSKLLIDLDKRISNIENIFNIKKDIIKENKQSDIDKEIIIVSNEINEDINLPELLKKQSSNSKLNILVVDKNIIETKLFLNKVYDCKINEISVLNEIKQKLNKEICIPKEFLRCLFNKIPDTRNSIDFFNKVLEYCSKNDIKLQLQLYNYDEYRYNNIHCIDKPFTIYEYNN